MKSHLQRLITIVEIPLFLITKLCNSEQLHFRHLVSHAGRAKAGGLFIKYFGGGHKFFCFFFCGTLLFICFLSDVLIRLVNLLVYICLLDCLLTYSFFLFLFYSYTTFPGSLVKDIIYLYYKYLSH